VIRCALALSLVLSSPLALAQGEASPTPAPTDPPRQDPQGRRRDKQRVRPSRLNEVGTRPGSSSLMLRLPGELVERALIDNELRHPRSLPAKTLRLRRLLRGCELRFSWSLNQRLAGKRLAWKLGPAEGPSVVGADKVMDEGALLCDLRCVERSAETKLQGYVYQARFRLTLGERTYDLLLELKLDLSEPETKPGLRFTAHWRGPFPEGRGNLAQEGFPRRGKRKGGKGGRAQPSPAPAAPKPGQ